MGASSCHCGHLCGLGTGWGAGADHEMRPSYSPERYCTSRGSTGGCCGDLINLAGADMMPKSAFLRQRGQPYDVEPAGRCASNLHAKLAPLSPKPAGGHQASGAVGAGDAAGGRLRGAADSGHASALTYFTHEGDELQLGGSHAGAPGARSRARRQFLTGAVYDGQWLGSVRDGFGRQTWPDGAEYIGEWRQNVAEGRGRFTYSDGDVYSGEWNHGLSNGFGNYEHKDGTTYAGLFVDDVQDGLGIERWPDGSKFIGTFAQGKKNGKGVYQWNDGSQYMGDWDQNHIDGIGTYTSANGRHFAGQWKFSMMHGCGRYTWSDGRCYEGQYSQDQKDGFGVFSWTDHRKYEGYWKEGRQHGMGRLHHPSGKMQLAEWSSGTRVAWLRDDPAAHEGLPGGVAASTSLPEDFNW